jgi:hypothetical protein
MRLDPAEVAELPVAAALLDQRRDVIGATPEWHGQAPGSVTYHAGHGYLAVGSQRPVDPDLQLLLGRLLNELDRTAESMDEEARLRAQVLTSGLRLVAGEPVSTQGQGTSREALLMAQLSIGARVNPPLTVEVLDLEPPLAVPAPAVISLALVQLAVNIAQHEHADEEGAVPVEAITIRTSEGPTFHVEWASKQPHSTPVQTQRHVRRRRGWGLGYVRMAADALGGVALPPAPAGPERQSVSFGLGSRSLTLPLALIEDGQMTRSTRAWDQEHHEMTGQQRERLAGLITEAGGQPGRIVEGDFHTARTVPGTNRVWLAMPPELGSDRVLDVLRGLDHERLLLSAPEPHATRLHALNVILRRGLGEPLATCYGSDWRTRFPAACATLGMPTPPVPEAPVYADPQLSAWLLAELGGELEVDVEGSMWLRPARAGKTPEMRLLGSNQRGDIPLTSLAQSG